MSSIVKNVDSVLSPRPADKEEARQMRGDQARPGLSVEVVFSIFTNHEVCFCGRCSRKFKTKHSENIQLAFVSVNWEKTF